MTRPQFKRYAEHIRKKEQSRESGWVIHVNGYKSQKDAVVARQRAYTAESKQCRLTWWHFDVRFVQGGAPVSPKCPHGMNAILAFEEHVGRAYHQELGLELLLP